MLCSRLTTTFISGKIAPIELRPGVYHPNIKLLRKYCAAEECNSRARWKFRKCHFVKKKKERERDEKRSQYIFNRFHSLRTLKYSGNRDRADEFQRCGEVRNSLKLTCSLSPIANASAGAHAHDTLYFYLKWTPDPSPPSPGRRLLDCLADRIPPPSHSDGEVAERVRGRRRFDRLPRLK